MNKHIVAGALISAALFGGSVQADELYVHNRPFMEANFVGRTAYVPVSSFLKSVGMGYRKSGDRIVVSEGGTAPPLEDNQVTVSYRGKQQTFSGTVRGGKVYVQLKPLAELLGLKVNHNMASGIVDVVQGRLRTAEDEKAAEELVAAKEADRLAKKEAWDKTVAAHREKVAARKAAEEAEKADEEGDETKADGEGGEEGDEKAGDEKGADDKAATSDETSDDEEKEVAKDDEPKEVEKVTESDTKESETEKEDEKKNEPPPKADLVIISQDANPNLYTGEVTFTVVAENQGYAPAEGVTARLKVTGPDNRVWLNKTVYGRNLAPDQRWEVVEKYKHRDGAAMPRGDFQIDFSPNFKSGKVAGK